MPVNVLVVDDEKQNRDLFTRLLQLEKCTTKEGASGEEALQMIEKEAFDVVLLDIKMPGIGGLEALKRIKQKKPQITVIMLTALGYDEDLIKKATEYGCSGYIGKNIPISQIISNFKMFVKASEKKD
jgi:two-component system response regulator (stage 0 sporulation protein F)